MWENAAEAFDSPVNYADQRLRSAAAEVMNLNVPHPTVRRNWQTTPAGYDRRLRQDSNNLSIGDTHIPIKTMK